MNFFFLDEVDHSTDQPRPAIKMDTSSSGMTTFVTVLESSGTIGSADPENVRPHDTTIEIPVILELIEENLNARFARLYDELSDLRHLTANWDSYEAEPPNATAIQTGRKVLNALRALDFRPDRIMPSAEGGLALVFMRDGQYADLECFNDGELLVGMSGGEDSPKVWQTDLNKINEAIRAIRTFLYAETSQSYANRRSAA